MKETYVIAQSMSTSKKKDGEDFEVLLNLTCELQQPDAEKVGALFAASYSGQALYLGNIIVNCKSIRVRRPKDEEDDEVVSVVLTLDDPNLSEVQRCFELIRDGEITPVTEAQGTLHFSVGSGEHVDVFDPEDLPHPLPETPVYAGRKK